MIAWRWNICKEEVRFVDGEEDVSDNALVCCGLWKCQKVEEEEETTSTKMRRMTKREEVQTSYAASSPLICFR